MRKRVISMLLAAICITLPFNGKALFDYRIDNTVLTANARTQVTIDGIVYNVENDYASVYKADKYTTGDIVIVSEIEGVPVTSINNGAFRGCNLIQSITIPDSVTNIGEYAFYSCSMLKSVNIPDSVSVIEAYTFSQCSSLTSITIPDSVTIIGDSAFSNCSNLESITIPDSVTVIGQRAFYSCKNITSITIPDSVTVIGKSAFSSCSNLTSITIPDSVTAIGPEILEGSRAVVIYGYLNSAAQSYAEENGIVFKKIDKIIDTVTTTVQTTTTTTITTTTSPSVPVTASLGDVNQDGVVDSTDASDILVAYAQLSTGETPDMTEKQKIAADVNKDESIDSTDASDVLVYYTFISTGGSGTLEEYFGF